MTRWTPTEDAVLLDYGRVSTRELVARLPRRTLRSIYARAHILGLTRACSGGRPYGGPA